MLDCRKIICSSFGERLTTFTEHLSYSTSCPWCCLLSLFKRIITSRKSYGYVQFTIVVACSFFWALLTITCIKQKWANKQQKGCLFFVCKIIMEFLTHASETLCWKSLTLSLINNEDEIYTFWITWDQALFLFRFENVRECMRTTKIGPDLRLILEVCFLDLDVMQCYGTHYIDG